MGYAYFGESNFTADSELIKYVLVILLTLLTHIN